MYMKLSQFYYINKKSVFIINDEIKFERQGNNLKQLCFKL